MEMEPQLKHLCGGLHGESLDQENGFTAIPQMLLRRNIMKACPCNKQRFISEAKIENFIGKILIFLTFLLETFIVGTR